jgi:argininosuccinate synthase
LLENRFVGMKSRGVYDQRDAAGFIKLNALRLRLMKKGQR